MDVEAIAKSETKVPHLLEASITDRLDMTLVTGTNMSIAGCFFIVVLIDVDKGI